MKTRQDSENGFVLELPEWCASEITVLPTCFPSLEERMKTVIRFATLNFQNKTGGPFAAGVFEQDSGRLIAMGVNRVVALNCSSAHAEIMALSLAQKRLGAYDLGGPGMSPHQLVVNWRPCAMCYGAVIWSGIRCLAIAGEGPELEELTGFDEGPLPSRWQHELCLRGIKVISDVLRQEAIAVFRAFAANQPFVYNARLGSVENGGGT